MLTARLDKTKSMRENMGTKLGHTSLNLQKYDDVKSGENDEEDGEIDERVDNGVQENSTPSCHNEELYAEVDVVYRRMTSKRSPSKEVATENRLRFFGHILRRRTDRLVQRVLLRGPEEYGYGIAKNALIPCKLSQKIEKVGQSYVQGQHTLGKMRVTASAGGSSPPIKSTKSRVSKEVGGVGVLVNTSMATGIKSFEQHSIRIGR
ncbi:hypothetical protein RB195_018378 [Necator americanus]|uniref:Uncharacterized protein n=1 Tax=Necator americanus TaxID=51031 RepID=A0ABR1C9I1_NECAM